MDAATLRLMSNQTPPAIMQSFAAGQTQSRQDAALTKAAQDFEGMFFGQMFEHLFSSVPVDPTFGGGSAEEMFRGLMIQEFGKAAAARGGLGLADPVRAALLEAQEGAR